MSSLEGSPFEAIHNEIVATQLELQQAREQFDSLQQQRDEAVLLATEPFKLPLRESAARIREIEATLDPAGYVERLRQLPLSELSFTALDLILRRDGTTAEAFMKDLQTMSQDMPYQAEQFIHGITMRKIITLGRFISLQADIEKAQNNGEKLSIFGFSMEWQEQIDVQAEHEGRYASTGVYEKGLNGYLGKASIGSFRVIREEVGPPGLLIPPTIPCAINLSLDTAFEISSELEWGAVETKALKTPDPVELKLINTEHSRQDPAVDWELSAAIDLSLLQPGLHGRTNHAPKTAYLVWGDNVETALQHLREDEAIPNVTAQALDHAYEKLQ